MCGISGFWGLSLEPKKAEQALKLMGERLSHRGPDDAGSQYLPQQQLGFSHRRLSIIGSEAVAHQPKWSQSQRSLIAYNGEIYNFKILSQELAQEGIATSGTSDTEVLIEAIEHWGIARTLPKLSGMFAFAHWDQKTQELTIARDTIGIKPLYYAWQNGAFYFASELHALKEAPDLNLKPQAPAMMLLLKHNAIGSPHSIYREVHKCPPGHFITIKNPKHPQQPQAFLTTLDLFEQGQAQPFQGSPSDAVDQCEQLLQQSIVDHMVSDVPVGAFLSGGFDSSLVCALAQKSMSSKLKTFTIGFHENIYNEAQHAQVIAKHLGTEHHELYLKPEQVIDAIPHILDHCDEPFADSSQIPTYFVSQMTREKVTVSLSGDGGDELFCGYSRYRWATSIWSNIQRIPKPLRPAFSRALRVLTPDQWDQLFETLSFIAKAPEQQMGQKLHKLSRILQASSQEDIYQHLVSHFKQSEELFFSTEPCFGTQHHSASAWSAPKTFEEKMMLTDILTYLPDDILTKVDRASMHNSLEARVPLLTPQLMRFAWSLPLSIKKDKNILKEIVYRHIPKELMDRPKMGFGIPIGQWLRGPLKPWAESLLSPSKLEQTGHLRPEPIQKLWREHQSGKHNWEYHLWDILVLQHWMLKHHA